MYNWSNINLTYVYDGSFEGYLTTIFYIFESKQIPMYIKSENASMPFTYPIFHIETDISKSYRVFQGILKISELTLYYTNNVFLSSFEEKEILILKYLIDAFKYGTEVNHMLALDEVLKMQKINKTVLLEIQRLKGFIRFSEIAPNLFFTEIEPDNNITEILCEHFQKRFPLQNFIIQDCKRNLIGIYNEHEISIKENCVLHINRLSHKELHYQDMWKEFFKTVAITERKNSRLQKQYMPKRYWKYIFETSAQQES